MFMSMSAFELEKVDPSFCNLTLLFRHNKLNGTKTSIANRKKLELCFSKKGKRFKNELVFAKTEKDKE